MHESRMIAEVVPPGDCAIEKVSGSRMATPLAPPRPGNTPMITPSTMPTNISAMFLKVRATTKPCSSDWISSIRLAQAQQGLERPLRQRHLEPVFEDQEEDHAVADADRRDLPPRVLAQPAHEEGDEHRRGDVDAGPADEPDIDGGRHQHAEDQLERLHLDEGLAAVSFSEQRMAEVHRGGHAYQEADVEGKIARLRTVVAPAGAQAPAVVDDDCAEKKEKRRHHQLGARLAKRSPALSPRAHFFWIAYWPWMNLAVFIRARWRAS